MTYCVRTVSRVTNKPIDMLLKTILRSFVLAVSTIVVKGVDVTTTVPIVPTELTSTLSAQVTVLDHRRGALTRDIGPHSEEPRAGRAFSPEISVTAKPISVGRSVNIDDHLNEQNLAILFPHLYSHLTGAHENAHSRNPVQVSAQPAIEHSRIWDMLEQTHSERRKQVPQPTTSTTTTTTPRPVSIQPPHIEKKPDVNSKLTASSKTLPMSPALLPQLLEELKNDETIRDTAVRQLHRRILFDIIRMAIGAKSVNASDAGLQKTILVSGQKRSLMPPISVSAPAATTTTTPAEISTTTATTGSAEQLFEEVHREGYVDLEHMGNDHVCFHYKGM